MTDPAAGRPHPYLPADAGKQGLVIVLEGVAGAGKSTIAAHLSERLARPVLHTAPAPLTAMQAHVNTHCLPLPHLLFYLAGALHVSDAARSALGTGHVLIDRYVSSLVANHCAVHDTDPACAEQIIEPFRHYLVRPDLTIYLQADPADITARTTARHEADPAARRPMTDPVLIAKVQQRFEETASRDPTAVHLDTRGAAPRDLADRLIAQIQTRSP
jgi:dTMP kinase